MAEAGVRVGTETQAGLHAEGWGMRTGQGAGRQAGVERHGEGAECLGGCGVGCDVTRCAC